jgi:hypothetical protein
VPEHPQQDGAMAAICQQAECSLMVRPSIGVLSIANHPMDACYTMVANIIGYALRQNHIAGSTLQKRTTDDKAETRRQQTQSLCCNLCYALDSF